MPAFQCAATLWRARGKIYGVPGKLRGPPPRECNWGQGTNYGDEPAVFSQAPGRAGTRGDCISFSGRSVPAGLLFRLPECSNSCSGLAVCSKPLR